MADIIVAAYADECMVGELSVDLAEYLQAGTPIYRGGHLRCGARERAHGRRAKGGARRVSAAGGPPKVNGRSHDQYSNGLFV